MNLILQDGTLEIQLELMERVWSVHLGQHIRVLLNTLQSVQADCPETTWREIRAPGTHLPGMFKAGTYYTERGREFWYARKGQSCLCLDMTEGYYKRVVLGSTDAGLWHAWLQSSVSRPLQAQGE